MSDIIERLLDMDESLREHERLEIAAEIERLKDRCAETNDRICKLLVQMSAKDAEIERLKALLRPFVDMVAEPEDLDAARRALKGK